MIVLIALVAVWIGARAWDADSGAGAAGGAGPEAGLAAGDDGGDVDDGGALEAALEFLLGLLG